MHRRQFLKAATATSAGLLLSSVEPSAAVEKTASMLPIIDTHQHLWNLEKLRLSWLENAPKLRKSFLTADYLAATDGLNVQRAVYMEVDVDPAQQELEAEYISGLCESDQHPTVAAVISGRPGSPDFAGYITAYRDSPYIKGVRQVLHVPSANPGLCLEKTFVRSVRLLGELGMRFDLCMRPAELDDGVKLADRCPDTPLVLDHCGNGDPQHFRRGGEDAQQRAKARDQWRRDIVELARRDNVVCKISGIVVRATPGKWTADDLAPVVNHCLDEFGPDRVMFGGDWPVCTLTASYAQWVHALKQIVAERPLEDQRKLFHDNARRFYNLAAD
jgi:predicted TIM-barrel fold metal-dependent hydrolase